MGMEEVRMGMRGEIVRSCPMIVRRAAGTKQTGVHEDRQSSLCHMARAWLEIIRIGRGKVFLRWSCLHRHGMLQGAPMQARCCAEKKVLQESWAHGGERI